MSDHWQVIAKMYSCPECGWVTKCYPDCPITTQLQEVVKYVPEWEWKD